MFRGSDGRGARRLLALLLAVLVVLAACGGDDDDEGSDGDQGAEAEADTAAILRPYTALNQWDPTGMWDPTKARTRSNLEVMRLVYDTLLRPGLNGELEPGLAESSKAVDPNTVEIVLKEGIQFSDGTPFDAEAVKTGLERSLAAKNLTGMRAEMFDVTSITIDSPTKLTLETGRPVAEAVATYAAGMEMLIVAPTATDPDTNPIGAGPFVLEEFVPGQVMRLAKNPNYFEADEIKVAGLEFVPPADPNALINGLRSGQIDLAYQQGKTVADAVTNTPGLQVETVLDYNSLIGISWCKSRPPLDDVRVRRALGHAMDREVINQLLYQGTGEVSWGLFPTDHPWHDEEQVEKVDHDPAEARRLLAEAGYPNGFEIGAFALSGDPQRAAEIVQEQWADVGVRLTLHTTTNALTDFYQQAKQPIYFLNDSGPVNIVRQYGTTQSIANVCQYEDAEYVEALRKLPTLPYGSDGYVEQFHVIDDLSNEKMVRFPLVLPPKSAISKDDIGGVRLIDGPLGSPMVDLFQIYKKR